MSIKRAKKISHVAVKKYQTNPEIENINHGIRQKQAQSQKPLELLWVDIIITQAITNQNKNHEVHMSFDVLCVEHTESQWLHIGKFLGGLKRKECFKSWWSNFAPTMPDIPNTEYVISEPNIKKLKEYQASLIKKTAYNSLPKNKKQKSKKISITLDLGGAGIYATNRPNKKYSPLYTSGRSKIIHTLYHQQKSMHALQNIHKYNDAPALCKAINEINRLFRSKLGISADLILRYKTGGCILNRKDFEIKMLMS